MGRCYKSRRYIRRFSNRRVVLVALQFFLDKRSIRDPPTPVLLRLAELVLTLNSFKFDGHYFHQISGVAMGTKMGPSNACLFMGHLEQTIFNNYQGGRPEFFRRYIDDWLGATNMSVQDLNTFIEYARGFHPSIDFSFEISSNS